jgi:hypothetical protein
LFFTSSDLGQIDPSRKIDYYLNHFFFLLVFVGRRADFGGGAAAFLATLLFLFFSIALNFALAAICFALAILYYSPPWYPF